MNKEINFAIVGCGHVGRMHINIIKQHHSFNLIAVCDSDPSVDIPEITPYFDNMHMMLGSKLPIDIICIATPNGLHQKQAILCLESGYNVIIEKPMALSREGALKIFKIAEKTGKKVFTVMQNRFSPQCIRVKNMLEGKLLGKIFIVQINCFWNRNESYYEKDWRGTLDLDGGALFTQFSHFVDIIYWWMGDIQNISGRTCNFNHKSQIDFEDTGVFHFNFKDGALGSFNFSTSVWKENLESSVTIIGEKGTIKLEGAYLHNISFINTEKSEQMKSKALENYSKESNHTGFYDDLAIQFRNNEKPKKNSMDSVEVIGIIERMYNSIKRDRSVNTNHKIYSKTCVEYPA